MRERLKRTILNLLWQGALRQYRADAPTVIAVGGSVGKTSTKEAIATMLEKAGKRVTKSQGNLATDFGIALSLLGYSDTPASPLAWLRAGIRAWLRRPRSSSESHYYVLEYSSDQVGDTEFLTQRIPPDIAVLCTLVPVHMEQYKTEEAMIAETLSLLDAVPDSGVIVANHDDTHQRAALTKKRIGSRTLRWYGIPDKVSSRRSGVWINDRSVTEDGLAVRLDFVGNGLDALTARVKSVRVKTAVLGEYQLAPLAAAAAVGECLKIPASAIRTGLQAYELPAGRGRLIEGRQDMTIIDDTANASPEAVKAGLSVLASFPDKTGKRRRVAILGTMNELGATAEAAHEDVAFAAAKAATYFVAVGAYAPQMLKAAQKAGMSSNAMIGFPTPERLLQQLHQVVQRGDIVYLKASQNGMFLERVVKVLMANPAEASRLLVRQGKFWQR